jgi:hypothetical protein
MQGRVVGDRWFIAQSTELLRGGAEAAVVSGEGERGYEFVAFWGGVDVVG